jgi:hypothetical protein
MKREKVISCSLTTEEEKKLKEFLIQRYLKENKPINTSAFIRELLSPYINGNREAALESKQDIGKDSKPNDEQLTVQETKQGDNKDDEQSKGPIMNFDDIDI